MQVAGKVVVVTGGASGIGRALCRRFAAEKARAVYVADLDAQGAAAVVKELISAGTRATAEVCDVRAEAQVAAVARRALDEEGRIDLFCSNAGVAASGGVEVPDEVWQRTWEANVMAHVHAARAVLPGMLARGEGYLLQTASAAGLLTSLAAAPYAVTKHAAVALAEWLSITYGARGIRVSCLCPQGVHTNMLFGGLEDRATQAVLASGPVITPEEVAEATIAGLAAERFLILPHKEVATYLDHKLRDYERWLAGMRKLEARLPKQA
jgi:NAD(P)-dependent dehydrogenase (short-subunit alcohol dehydrogenase family)